MLVVKTTSPATSPLPAKLHPSKTAPSSRTTVALLLGPYSKLGSNPIVDQLCANYSTHDPTRQHSSQIRGVRGPAQERLPAHHPLLREVDERKVCHSADRDSAPLADPPSRRAAHRLDQPGERDPTVPDQLCVERREGSLVAQETRSCLLEG